MSRRVKTAGLALALALLLGGDAGLGLPLPYPWPTLAAGGGAPARAWAQNLDNADVPTDDTGVVTQVQPSEQQGAEGEGEGSDAAATDAAPSEPPSEGSAAGGEAAAPSPEGEGAAETAAEGEQTDAEATASPEGDQQDPALVADPVFGSQKNADNLVNPQQKPDSSFIYDTSIAALQEADAYLNDQTVQVTGEVVGDRLKAEFDPGYCWIVLQANDETYAEIPVFIVQEMTESIDRYGSYGHKGTTLQIRGTFHLACPEHEGLTDLHADTVTVVEKGSVTEQVFEPHAFAPGAALVVLGLVMVFVFHRMREGQR